MRRLRRLFYCGEWIESHTLHVYLLHAPDFLATRRRSSEPATTERRWRGGLALKKAGNRIVALLGGRPIHPVSVRVGGWSRVPRRAEIAALGPDLEEALGLAQATLELVAGFEAPRFEREPRLVSLRHPAEYPMNDGRIVSTDRLDLAPGAWETTFEEEQVAWSNALRERTRAPPLPPLRDR